MSSNNHGLGFSASFRPLVLNQRALLGPALYEMQERLRRLREPFAALKVPSPANLVLRVHVPSIAGVHVRPLASTAYGLSMRSFAIPSFAPALSFLPITSELNAIAQVARRLLGSIASFHELIRRARHGACSDAWEAVDRGDVERLRLFTTDVLGMPASQWPAVAHALWEGRWADADDPIAYLCVVARREHVRAFAPVPIGVVNGKRRLRRLDARVLPRIEDDRSAGAYRLVELCSDYEIDTLTEDEMQLAQARGEGVTRQGAPDDLGWTPQKVERVWRRLNRRRERRRSES